MARQVSKLALVICFVQVADGGLAVRLFSTQTVRRVVIGPEQLTHANVTSRRVFMPPLRLDINGTPVESRFPITVERAPVGLSITLDIPSEQYVKAVLAGEVGAMQRPEVLKAMAVSARTYAFRFPGRHRREGYNLCDSTHCQDLRLTWKNTLIDKAVEDTDRELLWFRGKPAAAYYSQNCGGHGESAGRVWQDQSAPYLIGKPDQYCPTRRWRAEVRKDDLSRILGRRVDTVQVLSRTDSGRAQELNLGGGSSVRAASFRFMLGRVLGWAQVRSDWYTTQDAGGSIIFEGRGGGHGVGLCQQGAERMAFQGMNYRAILSYYFPGTGVGINAQGIEWKRLTGERVRLATTNPSTDQALLNLGDSIVRELEARLSLTFVETPELRVYPSVEIFRDATGEPGWAASSTRGNIVRLQPSARSRSLIRHELLHVLIENNARSDLPRWYREGLVLVLTQPAVEESATAPHDGAFAGSPRKAYRKAQGFMQRLIRLRGEAEVISWSRRGIPPELLARRPETAMPSQPGPQRVPTGTPD
jgi:stage II sporulation protein D